MRDCFVFWVFGLGFLLLMAGKETEMTETITLMDGEVLDLSLYPLPEGIEDDVFNVDLMAKAMGVSTVTLGKWIDQGMPVQKQGGNGQSYELKFSQCFAWRKWKENQDRSAKRSMERRAEQKAMLFLGDDSAAPASTLSAKEIREWSEAELLRNKLAEQKGQLVRVAPVQDLLDGLMVTLCNGLANAPDYLEQEFSLSPPQVVKAQVYFDNLLAEINKQISDGNFQAASVVPLQKVEEAG